MGLAISFVSNVPEKVWYHGEWCPSRGKGCVNTRLTTERGCCIWYNETQVLVQIFIYASSEKYFKARSKAIFFFNLLNKQYLADIEEHLGVTISQTGTDMKVPMDEFDGKVVYGQKRKANGNKRLFHF